MICSIPYNFQKKEEWVKCGNKDKIVELLKRYQFDLKEAICGVVYREVLDAHGAYNEFCVDIFDFIYNGD